MRPTRARARAAQPWPYTARMRSSLVRTVLSLAVLAASVGASAAPPPGGTSGEAVFRRVCAGCHLGLAEVNGVATADGPGGGLAAHAVPREMLRMYPPEAIVNALTRGKMQAQGATLTADEQRAVAQFASGRSLGDAPVDPRIEAGTRCTQDAPMSDPAQGPSWNGWGNGVSNTRFQPYSQGGIAAADLPRLKLKWAFGYVNAASARAQPALAGGRLFVAGESGQVHALDPRTGCTHWTYVARAAVVSALSVGPYHRAGGGSGFAVYLGDRKANVYALDAQSGELIWTRHVDAHPAAAITGSPTLYGGRLYVPVQGIGEEGRGGHDGYACCTFRGSVSALDASSGALIWKTYTVGENRPRGKSRTGVTLYGPAGGGIWSAPTVDAKRGLVYVATGNGYAEPAQQTTDAILALDLTTGAVVWSRQALAGDIWAMGCDSRNPDNPVCPPVLGPDFDFSASPALARIGGQERLVVPQKSGLAFGLDPAQRGRILWRRRFGRGSGLGGQWGVAIEDGVAFVGVADALTPQPGGMRALRLADGQLLWSRPPQQPLCGAALGCKAGQGAAPTAIPGAVLSGALDGALRAYSVRDGKILWTYDTRPEVHTVNAVKAHGGAMDGAGPIVVNGMMYINSGSGGLIGQPGNVLIALGLD